MNRTRAAMSRMFRGTDEVLGAIERGEDPSPIMHKMAKASPFHILAIGQASILDQLEAEDEADGMLLEDEE